MAAYLIWAIAGFILIIAELLTGTFYLLVLGLAALASALVAFAGGAIWMQVIIAAIVSVIGVFFVNRWRLSKPKESQSSNELNIGQSVVVESWVDEASGMARVKYRGTTWDAKCDSPAKLNDVLYIRSINNGVFHIGQKL